MKVNGRPKKSAKASPDQLPEWHKDLGEQLKRAGSYFQVDILHEGLITGFLKLLESESHFCGLAEKSVILMNKGRDNENVYSLFLHFDRKHKGKAQTIFVTLFPTREEQVSQAANDSNIKPLPVTEWNNARAKAEGLEKEIMMNNDPQEDVLFLTKCVNFNSEFQVLLKDVMLRYSQGKKTKGISKKAVPMNKENKESPILRQQEDTKDLANSVNSKREANNSLEKVAIQADAGHPTEKRRKTQCVMQEIKLLKKIIDEEVKARKEFMAKTEKCLEIVNEGPNNKKIPELPFSKVSGGDRSESEEDIESKGRNERERENQQKIIGELNTRIADLEAKEKRVEELQGQFNELKGAKELSEQSQEEQINQLNVKIRQHEKTLTDMQLQHKNDLEKKENENATLTAKLQKETEEFSKKIKELNILLETARNCENSNTEEFQKKLRDLEENKKDIEANNLKKIGELQTELSDSNKTNEELTNKLSDNKKEMKKALDEKKTLQNQKKETEDKLKKASETNSEYQEEKKSLKNKLEDNEKEYKRIIDNAEKKNDELRDQLASEKAENTFLRNQEQLYQICTAKLLDNIRGYVNVEGKSQQKQGRGQMSAKKKKPQEPMSARKNATRSIEEEQEIEYLPLTKRPILDVKNVINGGQIASDNLYAYLVAKNHSVNDKFILNPNFYGKANDIVDQNLNYSLAALGLEDKDYQNLAKSQYIVLPFLQKNRLWKLLVINNDQVLPLSSKHRKSTKKLEYFFFESASPRLTQDECSIILKPIDKAFCELGKLFDPNFSISTSFSSIPATVLEMPQYSKDVNSGIFVAQNVEFLFDDDHPASVLAQRKYDKVYDINFSESFKQYEIILYLLQCGKYAFKLQ